MEKEQEQFTGTMAGLVDKVCKYNKQQRIVRLIELAVRQDDLDPIEAAEMAIIQEIREKNGEIAEVKASRINNPNWDKE